MNDASSRNLSRLPLIALLVAVLAGLLMMAAGFGSRWGLWHFRTGFSVLRWATYLALFAVVISLVAMLRARPGSAKSGLRLSLVALILALGFVWFPWQWRRTARGVPPIHDITTDTESPPQFVAVLPLRAADNATNPVEYGGPDIATQQKSAYPDIDPIALDVPPQQAFQRALNAARAMGWDIVQTSLADGRIEATDQTFWFGFKDDVVIRILPAGGGSRIDVRSKSRVGGGDAGTNAKRVREYLARLQRG
jgi:uncharacterized protein (DUF1499 family)